MTTEQIAEITKASRRIEEVIGTYIALADIASDNWRGCWEIQDLATKITQTAEDMT